MKINSRLLLIAVLFVLALPLVFIGTASTAVYDGTSQRGIFPPDGAKGSGGTYQHPDDAVCVVGVGVPGGAHAGELDVDKTITNSRDCVVKTTPSIKVLAQTACTGGPGNDGYKHAWSTSICVDGSLNPISRVDLDNTAAMCTAQGGTVYTGGMCVAHSWQYMNVKSGETIPYRTTITPAGYKGRPSTDNMGFCYASMRMTSASGYSAVNVGSGCPSYHTSAANDPSGWYTGPLGTGSFQYQSSYDAGLGWSFASSQCLYAYGVKGILNAALTNAAGATATVPSCTTGTVSAAAGTCVDLTQITTMGDCLAAGATWDNWLPMGNGSGTNGNASIVDVSTSPASKIVKLDALTLPKNGGGNFYSGSGAVCTKCHTDQSRSYAERLKIGYVNTPHKKSGDDPKFATIGDEWGLKGVQCTVCHGTAKNGREDIIKVDATTGLPTTASGHNTTVYGSAVTQVCFNCHGTSSNPNANPAANIPTASGEFAETSKGLAPIANEFLNSPHARFTGTTGRGIIDKANYASSFKGMLCRSSNSVGGGSIITTMYQSGTAKTIPLKDLLTNSDCTNPGNVSATSGAAGFWVAEGSAASNSQGNCMTCHDVHWDFADPNPKAEPFRRECQTCHVDPGSQSASASNAPQAVGVNHPTTANTPFDTSKFASPCETCHMPKLTSGGSSMHLWRISTDASYSTASGSNVNLDINGKAWVALSSACGQCHNGAVTGAPVFSNLQMSAAAKAMHGTGVKATNSECLTCHTNSTHHHASTAVTDACTGCHSDNHSVGPPASTNANCLACHDSAIGTAHIIVPGTNHHGTGTQNCTACHTAEPFTVPAMTNAFCQTCHTEKIPDMNHPSDPATPQTCNTCHTVQHFEPWLDLPTTCGVCHNGTIAAQKDLMTLTAYATGIHKSDITPGFSTAYASPNLMKVNVTGSATCATTPTYDWNWGDSTSHGSGQTTSHAYATSGDKMITLTVDCGTHLASKAKIFTSVAPDLPPVPGATMTWDASTWTATLSDSSTDDNGVSGVIVYWGDGASDTIAQHARKSHTYKSTVGYTITQKATDTRGQSVQVTYGPYTPAYFSISGKVATTSAGTTGIPNATVTLKDSTGKAVAIVYTSSAAGTIGNFSFTNLKPGTYTMTVVKTGYTITTDPDLTKIVGPNKAGFVIAPNGY